ncbi:uncharacterized protein L201_002748 [Kwoniella dendrophila CBS 6074]|uniref:Uncharacterized protein n=1 Tax=Kwoniella dendrophila CBS 6074 TaxID=1295534 RepID=A0AAX4JR10_9TREE
MVKFITLLLTIISSITLFSNTVLGETDVGHVKVILPLYTFSQNTNDKGEATEKPDDMNGGLRDFTLVNENEGDIATIWFKWYGPPDLSVSNSGERIWQQLLGEGPTDKLAHIQCSLLSKHTPPKLDGTVDLDGLDDYPHIDSNHFKRLF